MKILIVFITLFSFSVSTAENTKYSKFINNSKNSKNSKELRYENAKNALKYAKENKDTKLLKEAIINYSLLNIDYSKYIENIKFLQSAIDTCDFTYDSLYLGKFYNILGVSFAELGQRPTAIRLFKKALNIFKKYNYKRGKYQAINNIGLIYYYNNEYDKAKEYFLKILNIYKEGDAFDIYSTYLNIANIYSEEKDYEQAKLYYEKVLSDKNINPNLRLMAYIGLAEMYEKLGDYKKAYHFLTIEKPNKDVTPKIKDVVYIKTKADILFKLDSIEKAIILYLYSLEFARKLNLTDNQIYLLKRLSYIYKKQRKYEKSLDYMYRAFELSDSINSQSILKSSKLQEEFFLQEQKRFDLIKEKNQIELLEHQAQLKITKQRIWLIIMISFFILLIITIFLLIKNQRNKIKYIKETNKLKLEYQIEVAAQLEAEVNHKIEQFTEVAIILSQQNEFLKDIKSQLDKVRAKDYPQLTDIKIRLASVIKSNQEKEVFYNAIENINSNIISNLKEKYPNITDNDIRLICLTKLDLSNKEISSLIGTSVKNIEMAKYRLKKKLGLNKEDSLESLLEDSDNK